MDRFVNSRAKLVNLKTFSTAYGWVHPGSEGVLVIDSDSLPEAKFGEQFKIELLASNSKTTFESTYMGSEDVLHLFNMPTAFSIERIKSQSVRKKCDGFSGIVEFNGESRMVEILDASITGVGFSFQDEIPPGTSLEMSVRLPEIFDCRVVQLNVEVKYCMENPRNPSVFRVGALITSMLRADRVRWETSIAAVA